ncbi:hypothetical protein [Pedobacter africanus]|uniref:Lipoprotein n=1 Tax=Pedobacter africanus TaxID=151894 RepID=A0A1W2CUH7_9SPHI|nr:hypothetical protein [Pedobacter africanus]SMC88861.1 hypothetical protein SAMN04488524_3247 [Pedobacter africanus]
MKKIAYVMILSVFLLTSCKDEFTDNINIKAKEDNPTIQKVEPIKSKIMSQDKRKDRDWETSVGH